MFTCGFLEGNARLRSRLRCCARAGVTRARQAAADWATTGPAGAPPSETRPPSLCPCATQVQSLAWLPAGVIAAVAHVEGKEGGGTPQLLLYPQYHLDNASLLARLPLKQARDAECCSLAEAACAWIGGKPGPSASAPQHQLHHDECPRHECPRPWAPIEPVHSAALLAWCRCPWRWMRPAGTWLWRSSL